MSERLDAPDPSRFPEVAKGHVHELPAGLLLGRVHSQAGVHPYRWNQFRSFGPTTARFDHHRPPPREKPDRSVLYAAPNRPGDTKVLRTCVAECFRDRGSIELNRDAPYFVLFRLTRPLRLLDMADSNWVALAGGNAAISSGPTGVCRDWSRAIWERYAGVQAVDGMLYTCSNDPSQRSAVLWERALDAVPARPVVHLPLTSADLRADRPRDHRRAAAAGNHRMTRAVAGGRETRSRP